MLTKTWKTTILTAGLLLSMVTAQAAVVSSLVIKPTARELAQAFGTQIINPKAAEQAAESLRNTLEILTGKSIDDISSKDLSKALSFDPELGRIIAKSEEDLTQADIATLIKKTAQHSNMFNENYLCGRCVEKELREMGVQAVVQKAPSSMVKHLKAVPKNVTAQRALVRRIAKEDLGMSAREIKQFVSPRNLDDVKLRNVAAALLAMKNGTKGQKALGDAIRNFNTADGKTYFNHNDLLLMLVDGFKESELEEWAAIVNKLAKKPTKGQLRGRTYALAKYFEDMAEEYPHLREHLAAMKDNGANCWRIW